MIQEIVNFFETIPKEYHTEGLSLIPGLHIIIELDEKGNLMKDRWKSFIIQKKDESIEYDFDFSSRYYFAKVPDMQKAIDTKKKIHSIVPYVLLFKNLSTDDKKSMKKKDWDILSGEERLMNIIKPYLYSAIKERIIPFYEFFLGNSNVDKSEMILLNNIKKYSWEYLLDDILTDEKTMQTDYNNSIAIYFNVPIEFLIKWHDIHIRDKVFNKNDFNTDDNEYGLSNFLSSAPTKKVFMAHQTTNYKVINRIHYSVGIKLAQFKNLLINKKLPNTIPIFIDKEELNREFIRLYNRDRNQSFRDIIRQLFEQHAEDISNYYLINWANRMGIVINDVDYVPKFKFYLDGFVVSNLMQLPNTPDSLKLENVFTFEKIVVQAIFNRQLVSFKDDKIFLRYFDEIKFDGKYNTQLNFQNTLKYRKNFYDYIYKSKEDAISGNVFYDLLISILLDDIKHDEFKDNKHSHEWRIKEKLNILFSLNKNFDKKNKNFGGIDMATKISEFRENMRRLLNDNDYHIQTDQEFAFTAGQLIYYILTKNQGTNKTHALLEPYISKNNPELFKVMITRGIDQYKHAFDFGSKRFEKLSSEVLCYECSTKIKDLLPTILAGYFSQPMIFEKTIN